MGHSGRALTTKQPAQRMGDKEMIMPTLRLKILAAAAGLLSLSLSASVSAQDVHVAPSHDRTTHGMSFAPNTGPFCMSTRGASTLIPCTSQASTPR